MAFYGRDDLIYDELTSVEVAAAVTKGQAVQLNDVLGFYLKAVTAEDITYERANVVVVYRMRQVMADKTTGTGNGILNGERVYYYPATDKVSSTATGTAGTDYMFCGWCKTTATAADTQVLINFDGTRYDLDA